MNLGSFLAKKNGAIPGTKTPKPTTKTIHTPFLWELKARNPYPGGDPKSAPHFFYFFFVCLNTRTRRPFSLEVQDSKVHEPEQRASKSALRLKDLVQPQSAADYHEICFITQKCRCIGPTVGNTVGTQGGS